MSEPAESWFQRNAATTTIQNAFETFLQEKINISGSIRTTASAQHHHLRDFISTEYDRDNSFPTTLSILDRDFLGGSFARHTKVWPLDDIDIYIPLDGHGLIFYINGVAQPIIVVSDNLITANPLLKERWIEDGLISSRKLITGFARILDRHYPDATKVKRNGQAVTVTMISSGIGFDVVPCFSMEPYNGEAPFYLIPSGSNGWIRTNPRKDNEIADQLNKNNNGTFRKAVKLIKYWNQEKSKTSFNSYYIELAIAKEFIRRNALYDIMSNLSYAIAVGFYAFNQAVKTGNLESFVPFALPVEPGPTSVASPRLLDLNATRAKEAWDWEKEDNQQQAMTKWKSIFGPDFGV